MFWIGIVIGFIVATAIYVGIVLSGWKIIGLRNAEEALELGELLVGVGNDREATINVYHDGELIDTMTLEEK